MEQLFASPAVWGTLPQWLMAGALTLGLFKVVPEFIKVLLTRKTEQETGWAAECQLLRQELRDCQKQCDEDSKYFREELKGLHEELFGMRRQHIQEQLSLINSIIRSVDAPELRTLVKALENAQSALLVSQQRGGS